MRALERVPPGAIVFVFVDFSVTGWDERFGEVCGNISLADGSLPHLRIK